VVTPETGALLAGWLAARDPSGEGPGCPAVFVNVEKGKGPKPLTPCGLRCIFRDMAARSGFVGGFSPHDLRRTFATLSTERGAPSRLVQLGGRWSNIGMVERYTRKAPVAAHQVSADVGVVGI